MPESEIIWTSERSVWVELDVSSRSTSTRSHVAQVLSEVSDLPVRSVTQAGEGMLIEFEIEHADDVPDSESISACLHRLASEAAAQGSTRTHLIRVCYDPRVAPDLVEVAQRCGMTCEQVIKAHQMVTYEVDSIGFAPGFGYLKALDSRLCVPRRSTPRTHVPAGSIGIADRFTAVYPSPTPGGWNLIGRTAQVMFDPNQADPCVFRVGDSVRFESISHDEFESMRSDA